MLKIKSLFSSSSGNCTYISDGTDGILIDIGISARRAETALIDEGINPAEIKGIFITHEHSDHISGVRVFASRYGIPVYATRGTLTGMDEAGVFLSNVEAYVMPESGIKTGNMTITGFATSHDTPEPCGYVVRTPDSSAAVATDMGIVTDTILGALTGIDSVLIESNHDLQMLRMGPYPYALKQRILSDKGHLCNDGCAALAKQLYQSGTRAFYLGHLSKENNLPALAYQTTKLALDSLGATDYTLEVVNNR